MGPTFERALNGELIVDGMEEGDVVEVSSCLLPDLLRLSMDGGLYPYQVHCGGIHYNPVRREYAVVVREWAE